MRSSTGTGARPIGPTAYLLMTTFRVWLAEVPLAAVNAFVLMDRVYTPRVGALHAHQLAMATRIVLALVLAYVITRLAGDQRPATLLLAGLFWMTLWLGFEWGGSLLIRRPVDEILVGWHIERGYMWPYVLVTYLLAPLVMGLAAPGWRGRVRSPSARPARRSLERSHLVVAEVHAERGDAVGEVASAAAFGARAEPPRTRQDERLVNPPPHGPDPDRGRHPLASQPRSATTRSMISPRDTPKAM